MMLCINTPAPELAMQEEPGLETRMANKIRCLEREGTVGVREEEQRWRDGEQEGWSSPRCRIETAVNPGRTQTKENWRHENRDYSTKEAMGRLEAVRVEGR
jgi:hypothetical protein